MRKPWKPWIVEHDQVVGAGAGFEIYQFFLKKICIRKRGDLDVNAFLGLIIACGLLKRFAFNSRDHGECELFLQRLRVGGATAEPN